MLEDMRRAVAVAGCRAEDGGDAALLYPDADWPFLRAAMERAGIDAVPVSWDDERVDWARFDVVLISSTWDSVDRPEEYLAWVRATAQVATLLNPAPVVEWSLDKAYLLALEGRGVPVVPTRWVRHRSEWAAPEEEFVVKPSISAGGRETARYRPDEVHAAEEHVARLLGLGQTVMVQPYMAGVDGERETKLVYLDGVFSHAVRISPLLAPGTGVQPRPWERPFTVEPTTPGRAQEAVAREVLAAVSAEVGVPPLYARVDLIPSPAGEPLLGEVELVDPSLFLRVVPDGAVRMADAIRARCQLR